MQVYVCLPTFPKQESSEAWRRGISTRGVVEVCGWLGFQEQSCEFNIMGRAFPTLR
jgi:hypothetical protein